MEIHARGGLERLFTRSSAWRGPFRAAVRRISHGLESLVIGLGVAVCTFAMFVPVARINPFNAGKPAVSSAQQTAAHSANKPAPVSHSAFVTPPTHCSRAYTNSDGAFASCPSFALDFATLKPGSLNSTYFNTYVGAPVANNEKQFYTANTRNLRIDGGNLVLEAQTIGAPTGYQFSSAKVDTKGKEDFLYGKLVVRAKMPAGTGTWPAMWLLPSQPKYAHLSSDPYTSFLSDGELDIAEGVGMHPHMIYSVAHSLMYDDNGVDRTYFDTTIVPDSYTAFHDYEMDWTPYSVTFKVDGNTFFSYAKPAGATYRSWPYDQPFYLILNLALGGDWAGQQGIDASALPAALRVQSIHYYPYVGAK